MKLFLQKNENFRALGAPPPDPRASGGWGFAPKPPASIGWGFGSLQSIFSQSISSFAINFFIFAINFFTGGEASIGFAPRPPKQPPPLRISGSAPAHTG